MQQGIKRAGTNSISVAFPLLHHAQPIEFPFHGMVHDMQPVQAGDKFLVLLRLQQPRSLISDFVIGNRFRDKAVRM
jgi:hypothetical protein